MCADYTRATKYATKGLLKLEQNFKSLGKLVR